MNKTQNKNIIFGLLFFSLFVSLPVYSQKNKLVIYTDGACGRCQFAKQFLKKNHILNDNLSINQGDIVMDMWNKLYSIGVAQNAKIELPVIVLNGVVVFPVVENSVVTDTDLSDFLINLDKFYKLGSEFPYSYTGQDYMQIYNGEKEPALVIEQLPGVFYIIVGSYKHLEYARKAEKLLKNESFKRAKIIQSGNKYRISAGNFTHFNELANFTEKLPEKYKNFWILFKDKNNTELIVDNPDGTFAVVAGSFSKKINAVELQNKLKSSGFSDCIINKRNNLYRVVLKSFDKYEKAVSYKKNHNDIKNLWLLLY